MTKPPGKKTPGSLEHQMKIASFDEPRPRGAVIGKQITGPRLTEAEHFRKCPLCGGYVDMRDRV